MEFFVERSLGGRIVVAAMRAAGCVVHAHADHFAPDCPDARWLREVGDRGWVVLTKDAKIRYRPGEKKALLQSGVRVFILTGKGATGQQMAESLVCALPGMIDVVASTRPPFIAHVWKGGEVRVMERG